MTKALIKILVFACFCFDLHAEPYVNFSILPENDGRRVLKTEIKNPDVQLVSYKMRFFTRTDDTSEWQLLKTSSGLDYILEFDVVGGGRESSSIDLFEVLKRNTDLQQIKVEYEVIFRDQNGREQISNTFSREYSLDCKNEESLPKKEEDR